MNVMKKVRNLFTKDGLYFFTFYFLRFTRLERYVPDEPFLKLKFRCYMHHKLNLYPPVTYNEKLQWLKLHDRNPLYTTLVDKYEVKKYVANIIGEQYIIPTLGVWDNVDDIDFNRLPDQFVLKCNHDSGGIVICKDKTMLNIENTRSLLKKHLKTDCYKEGREWPYKNVKRKIIAEPYLEDKLTKELRDYKFFVFDGDCRSMFIASERQKQGTDTKFDFFDMSFNHLDLRHGHPNAEIIPCKPVNFELMSKLAEKLGKGFPHVRVDFYEVDGKVFFGEMTFYHHTGMMPFEPSKWDTIFGNWLDLSKGVYGLKTNT